MLQRLFLIAAAGAAGSLARYFVSGLGMRWHAGGLPVGTLVVNIIGCFLFGAVWALAEQRNIITSESRLVVLVGFLGAFTTFSTFGFETVQLWREAKHGLALANALAQNIGGIAAAWLGIRLFS